jgi:C4-dicarboxylate transporter DctM subunit
MISLYGGWATPSEAAGVASVVALFLVMAIYKLRSKDYRKILDMTIKESTMILLIIATSFLFGAVMTKLYVTQSIINAIVGSGFDKWSLMIMINIFLLILGCFMPPVAIIVILAPILYPVLVKYGFDPIWFGVIMTINMEVGLITPPVGLNLYIVQGIAPDVPLSRVLVGSAPFVLILLLGIVICSIWPELTLWLPNKMITR